MEGPKRPRRHARVRETAPQRYAEAAPQPELEAALLDSDIIIDILRGNTARARSLAEFERAGGRVYCCAVSFAEVFAGVRPGEQAETEAFFAARGEVVIDAATGRRAGEYLARYRRSHALGVADALIAATATSAGLRLWTGNRRDYPMPDLKFFEA